VSQTTDLDEFLPDEETRRRALAQHIKSLHDVTLPRLAGWNYEGCRHHPDGPVVGCEYRLCGGDLWRTQKQGIAWMHVVGKGILADVTGGGKTNQILGLCCLLKQRGELTHRAVIVCQTPAAEQWLQEAHRWAPGLNVIASLSGMTRARRIEQYVTMNWDVLIIGYHMLIKDIDMLIQLAPLELVVSDDVDPLRSSTNATATAFTRLTELSRRAIVINATPLQTRLQELHATSLPIGGFQMFGSLEAFERKYVRKDIVTDWDRETGRKVTRIAETGYKNMDDFRAKIEPIYIRRTDDEIDDANMPEVMPPTTHWLDLSPLQRARYKELQRGVLRLIEEEGETVKRVTALAKVTYGAEICSGLPALGDPDGPGASVKLDWLMHQLETDWNERKVVVFVRFKGVIRALKERMEKKGMSLALIVGGEQTRNHALRQAQIDKFWNDPACKVCVGTTALERSLNLQVANTVVNYDMLLNPARMTQILGRIKRGGSKHKHVFVHNLLVRDTQEERYMGVLEKRQALIDFVWGETNDLFEQLSPIELLQLIKP
jgi:SNF2 family DNA or RNA helicase